MDDTNNNDPKNPVDEFAGEDIKKIRAEKSAIKLAAVKAANKYNKDGSKWTLVQEILQEIIATHVIADPNAKPYIKVLSEELRTEIQIRYADNEEMRTILLDAVPSDNSIQNLWLKKEGWEEAVWAKVRGTGLFSKERRSQMVNALFNRGLDKSDNAAKIWLTLSGDYSEKGGEVSKNQTLESFREINEILHKKPKS